MYGHGCGKGSVFSPADPDPRIHIPHLKGRNKKIPHTFSVTFCCSPMYPTSAAPCSSTTAMCGALGCSNGRMAPGRD